MGSRPVLPLEDTKNILINLCKEVLNLKTEMQRFHNFASTSTVTDVGISCTFLNVSVQSSVTQLAFERDRDTILAPTVGLDAFHKDSFLYHRRLAFSHLNTTHSRATRTLELLEEMKKIAEVRKGAPGSTGYPSHCTLSRLWLEIHSIQADVQSMFRQLLECKN